MTPQRLREALVFSSSSFDGLLSYALTGDPMAECEAAAVKPFAKQQVFHKGLPRVLFLGLLGQKMKRASRAASEVSGRH